MSYRLILAEAIEKSGRTLKEITTRCKESGVKITESYISQLRSGKQSSPSSEITEALSDVLNINHEILEIESYLDKAPEVFLEFLTRVRLFHTYETFQFSKDELDIRMQMENKIESIKNDLADVPFSEFILSINESTILDTAINYASVKSSYYNLFDMIDLDENLKSNPGISFEEILSITKRIPFEYDTAIGDVEDDSLEPLISNGSKVVIDEKTHSPGDIVHYWDMDSQNYMIRQYYISGDNIILIAPNHKYEPIIKPHSKVKILGRVTKYVGFLADN
jgi:transcriptional regulator with XRE-family HTH domain